MLNLISIWNEAEFQLKDSTARLTCVKWRRDKDTRDPSHSTTTKGSHLVTLVATHLSYSFKDD